MGPMEPVPLMIPAATRAPFFVPMSIAPTPDIRESGPYSIKPANPMEIVKYIKLVEPIVYIRKNDKVIRNSIKKESKDLLPLKYLSETKPAKITPAKPKISNTVEIYPASSPA